MGAMTVIAAAAVTTAAVGVYSALTPPKAPNIPPPPPPASYYSYDESGNPAGEQVWDAAQNAYVYKPAPLSEEQKLENAKRKEIRNRMLDNLNKTPEDRVKAYEEYATTFSNAMHKDVDKRYEDLTRAKNEEMNARGLMGSRAYVDTTARLAEEKVGADVDIAERANLAKEELARGDRNFWLETVGQLDAGQRADMALAMEKANTASGGAQLGTAGLMSAYNIDTSNRLKKWEVEMEASRNLTNQMTDTASGLAFLYGYGSGWFNKTPAKA